MKVAITGSHGLIGSAVAARLRAAGHAVAPVVRGPAAAGEIAWDPGAGRLEAADFEGVDAVVHLAGAGLAERRWTAARKQVLVDSRVEGTGLLCSTLAGMRAPPAVLVSASAVGYYGDRGDEELTEASPPGRGFLADLCQRWEAATAPAAGAGIRVVCLRTGIVLSSAGGALGRQLALFRLGLGGRLGSGRQHTSWVTLADEVGAIELALTDSAVAGAINVCAPHPVTNAEFAATLAGVLHRPAVVRVPSPVLRLALGAQLADEVLLGGQRALPVALQAAGYDFAHPHLEGALASVLAHP